MAGSNPALIVRVAATIDDLKKKFGEVKAESQATAAAVAQMGGAPTAGMQQLASATNAVVIPADRLKNSLRQFDGVLASLGFNISSESNALIEMASASGKTVAQVGLLTTAGLVLATAIASWKFGRVVADFFDLDEKISNATAKLLGFGDVAAETAGAKADVLAKATRLAGTDIKDMALAMAINEEAAKRQAASWNTAESRLKAWHDDMGRIDLAAFTKDLNSQAFSIEELAKKYGVHVGAIQNFTREQKAAADAVEAAADKLHAANERKLRDFQTEMAAEKPYRDAINEIALVTGKWRDVVATIPPAVQAEMEANQKLGIAVDITGTAHRLSAEQIHAYKIAAHEAELAARTSADAVRQLTEAHAAEIAQLDAATEARKKFNAELVKQREAADAAKAAMRALGGSAEYDLSTDEGMQAFQKANPGASIGVGKEYFKTHTLQQAIAAGLIDLYAAFKGLFGSMKLPGLQGGAENFPGGLAMVGERGPELVSLPRGANVYPSGSSAGAGVVNHIVINVTQPLGSPTAIAAAVDDALMKRLRDTGARF